jgi:hypothetical protein
MQKVRRLSEPLDVPIKPLEPIIQHRVIMPDDAQIRLEMLHIDGIKAHNRRIRKQIQRRERVAQDIRPAICMYQRLKLVQRGEQRDDGRVVAGLRRVEAGFVDARADERDEPGCYVVDLGAQRGRVEGYGGDFLVGDEGVEGRGQPGEHLGAFVVDDALGFLIPEERHAVDAFVGRVVAEVELVHETAGEEVVAGCVGVGFVEAPAGLTFGVGADDGDGEDSFQVLDVADEVGAVGKGAEETWLCWLVVGYWVRWDR